MRCRPHPPSRSHPPTRMSVGLERRPPRVPPCADRRVGSTGRRAKDRSSRAESAAALRRGSQVASRFQGLQAALPNHSVELVSHGRELTAPLVQLRAHVGINHRQQPSQLGRGVEQQFEAACAPSGPRAPSRRRICSMKPIASVAESRCNLPNETDQVHLASGRRVPQVRRAISLSGCTTRPRRRRQLPPSRCDSTS